MPGQARCTGVTSISPADRRRKRAVIALLSLAGAAVLGLGNGLTSCTPQSRAAENGQPVSAAQVRRLASVRLNDFRDGQSGFRATIGTPGSAVHLTGWLDWRRPLVYLASTADRPGAADGLVEAVPELVAVHLGRRAPAADGTGIVDPYPPPPAQPPTDDWRVRRLAASGPDGSPFDGVLALLFGLSATQPDDARALAVAAPRFLRRTMVNGVAVDVITGPAALPPTVAGPARPAIGAASGAEVTYWLDDNGRLRRLDALLRKDLPVRIEFNRDDRTAPAAVEMLGGAPVSPRPVTAAEAAVLAKLGVRERAVHGGRVSVLLPYAPAGLVRADGWLDWTGTTAYLATRDADDPGRATLVWADRMGVTTRATPAGASSPPPLAPPKGGWQLVTWAQHDRQGSSDLDILLGAALAGSPDPGKLRTRASWLRTDAVGGVPVTVYEIREAAEAATAPGQGLLRYWVDGSGTLRRVELRTGYGAYGYLDVTPGHVPPLTRPAR